MTTKIKIYNDALGFIGTQRLHSTTGLSENVSSRYELDDKYDNALAYMLEQASWKFALRTSELSPDADITTTFGPLYPFSIPEDYVRLAGISTTGDFVPGSEPDYREENGYWYSDCSLIYVRYVSNGATYGLDLGAYPQHYQEALAAWLAYKTVLPISKDRGDRNDILAQHNRALNISKRLHAISDPVLLKPPGSWTMARGGMRGPTFRNGRMVL